jgi:hypothetical protein
MIPNASAEAGPRSTDGDDSGKRMSLMSISDSVVAKGFLLPL